MAAVQTLEIQPRVSRSHGWRTADSLRAIRLDRFRSPLGRWGSLGDRRVAHRRGSSGAIVADARIPLMRIVLVLLALVVTGPAEAGVRVAAPFDPADYTD